MKNKLELTYDECINIIKWFKIPRLKCRITDEELLKALVINDEDFLDFIFKEFKSRNYMRTEFYKVIREENDSRKE